MHHQFEFMIRLRLSRIESTDTIKLEKGEYEKCPMQKTNLAKLRVLCRIQNSSWMSWNAADGTCVSMHEQRSQSLDNKQAKRFGTFIVFAKNKEIRVTSKLYMLQWVH